MKISMYTTFHILENKNGKLVPLSKKEVSSLSIGGYYFVINGKEIPFDWDAFCGDEEDNIFEFETGYGFLFNDFELSDCYDEDYEVLGIARENITAAYLSSVDEITEFHINFIDEDGDECDLGSNASIERYKIKLLEITFTNVDTGDGYDVRQEVLDRFNVIEINNDDEEYVPSSTNGDYSPGNPWDAPGMSPRDFI
jgi:hypothetical protein